MTSLKKRYQVSDPMPPVISKQPPVLSKEVEKPPVSFADTFFKEVQSIAGAIDIEKIESLAKSLADLKKRGRLFILGVGSSAATASQAAGDFRKLCDIEAYVPTDNVAELSGRASDGGWDSVFAGWLRISRLSKNDALLVLSVDGGHAKKNLSQNIIHAIDLAKSAGAKIYGIVGRADGYTAEKADICVLIPQGNELRVAPHAEAFQTVVWQCLVSHPALQTNKSQW